MRDGRGLPRPPTGGLDLPPRPLAIREPSKLLSSVAHELRGPLAALVASSEILADDFEALARDQAYSMVASIHRRTLWLQSLVENLLSASTIREGKFQVHPQPTSIVDIVTDILPMIEPLLAAKDQRLRFSAQGTPEVVWADGRRIGQVVVNLILNAGKFAAGGTPIDVTLTFAEGLVRVAVADRGPGIPRQLRDRIFEPYFQTGTADESGKGVGLGLSIVKSIVDAHGGRVGARGRRGGGACVWFELSTAAAIPSRTQDHSIVGEETP